MKFELPQLGKEPVDCLHFPTTVCAFVFRALEFFTYEKMKYKKTLAQRIAGRKGRNKVLTFLHMNWVQY